MQRGSVFEAHSSRSQSGSFTLIELLVVLAIGAGLIVLAMKGLASSTQSVSVTSGAALLDDALTDGHRMAMVQNTPVEVRFYDVSLRTGAAPAYDVAQLRWMKADGTTPPAERPVILPPAVAIDATAVHSTLIASSSQAAKPDPSDARLNAQTRVFHFLADGTTDLNPATNWFLTVRPATQADPTHFPADWACVRIDPMTGKVQTYRP